MIWLNKKNEKMKNLKPVSEFYHSIGFGLHNIELYLLYLKSGQVVLQEFSFSYETSLKMHTNKFSHNKQLQTKFFAKLITHSNFCKNWRSSL